MPRVSGQKEYISLTRGLITEASPLAFPEGATGQEVNFTVDRDGLIRKRRQGFQNLVSPFTVAGDSPRVENVFYWRGPSLVCVTTTDEGNIDVDPSTTLHFHAVDDDFTKIVSIPVADAVVKTQLAETTNLLLITLDGGQSPVVCEYDSESEQISVNTVNIYIRDFELVEDGLGITERPSSLTDNHNYNLLNAGWYQRQRDANDANTSKSTVDAFFDEITDYPSNADIVSAGILVDSDGNTVFNANEVVASDLGNSVAPRGHYVYNIQDINREPKIFNPSLDGAPNTSVVPLGTADLSGTSTYNPDEPTDSDNPPGGGGVPPYTGGGGIGPVDEEP